MVFHNAILYLFFVQCQTVADPEHHSVGESCNFRSSWAFFTQAPRNSSEYPIFFWKGDFQNTFFFRLMFDNSVKITIFQYLGGMNTSPPLPLVQRQTFKNVNWFQITCNAANSTDSSIHAVRQIFHSLKSSLIFAYQLIYNAFSYFLANFHSFFKISQE